MSRYFYDFEFIEDGKTIAPISIGIVCEDGREYYAVFEEIHTDDALKERIRGHRWIMENVIPHLPLRKERGYEFTLSSGSGKYGDFWLDSDLIGLSILPRRVIKNQVRDFFLSPNEPVELWGYYSAYDHVALAQLWGPMMNRPKGIPMWTNDVQQLAYAMNMEGILPEQPKDAHNALSDARWTKEAYEVLKAIDSSGVCVTTRPDNDTAAQAVFQALGEASMCWENPTGAGVFQDAQASAIARRLLLQLGYQVPAAWSGGQ